MVASCLLFYTCCLVIGLIWQKTPGPPMDGDGTPNGRALHFGPPRYRGIDDEKVFINISVWGNIKWPNA